MNLEERLREKEIGKVINDLNFMEEIFSKYYFEDPRACASHLIDLIVDTIFVDLVGYEVEKCQWCHKWFKINEGGYDPDKKEYWYCENCWGEMEARAESLREE